MSAKVNDLLNRVNQEDCRRAVLQVVADDMNPALSFNLNETMQVMTKKVSILWIS